jgi:RecB family exonuclease
MQRMDPRIRGELYHSVQTRFLTAMRAENLLPVHDVEAALKRLERVLADVAAEFKQRCMPAIAVVWDTDLQRIRGDLRAWVQHTAASEGDWTPIHFEYAFEDVELAEGLKLKGLIDVIEQHESGVLRVTDYKTGKPPEKPPVQIGGGQSLQPALYAMAAAQKLMGQVTESRLFYATIRGNYVEHRIRVSEETCEAAESVLRHVDKALRRGELPAAPVEDACEHCDYVSICGPYEEERVGRKNPAPLRRLVHLREQP